jgi:hypothetical protein
VLSRFAKGTFNLTPFTITSYWLALDASPHDEPFECATWLDSERQRRWAKVVVGPSGCEKNAYGPVGTYSKMWGLQDEWDCLDWARAYKYNV